MPPPSQLVDELWLCLCPSFKNGLARASLGSASLLRHRSIRNAHFSSLDRLETRPQSLREGKLPIHHHLTPYDPRPLPKKGLQFHLTWSARPPTDSSSRTAAILRIGTNGQLHQELLRRAEGADLAWTRHLVHMLVHDRGEQPDERHYYALILAHADPRLGSVEGVERLLAEMEGEGIEADDTVQHAVLKVTPPNPSSSLYASICITN